MRADVLKALPVSKDQLAVISWKHCQFCVPPPTMTKHAAGVGRQLLTTHIHTVHCSLLLLVQAMVASGKWVMVDVRPPAAYATSHPKGAVNCPM
jgi:hypothetical protein